MTTADIISVLNAITPHFQVVNGYYTMCLSEQETEEELYIPHEAATQTVEQVKRYERDMNRCFIIANVLDELDVEQGDGYAPADLLTIAKALAGLMRDGLASRYPEEKFDVEIIGADGVEDEPLELCVTFSRAI